LHAEILHGLPVLRHHLLIKLLMALAAMPLLMLPLPFAVKSIGSRADGNL
jgi:hypothetical protein